MKLPANRISSGIAVLAAVSAAFFLLVWWSGSHTLCLVRTWTGLPCPGCGLGHAGSALLRGDVIASLKYHPLLAPTAAVLVLSLWKNNRPRLKWVYIALAAAFVGFYLVRMALYFPDGPYPMVYNPGNVARRLYLLLTGGRP